VRGAVLFDDKPAAGVKFRLCKDVSSLVGHTGCKGQSYEGRTGAAGTHLFPRAKPGHCTVVANARWPRRSARSRPLHLGCDGA